jgi:hypothetical protein
MQDDNLVLTDAIKDAIRKGRHPNRLYAWPVSLTSAKWRTAKLLYPAAYQADHPACSFAS